jgi:hypothetical protein
MQESVAQACWRVARRTTRPSRIIVTSIKLSRLALSDLAPFEGGAKESTSE